MYSSKNVWRSFYITSRKAALYLEGRILYLTFKNGNDVEDLSVLLLTQGGKKGAMTYIAQHSLIPTFNWLLIVEKEYSEYRMNTSWKPFATTRVALLSYLLSLNFFPREHKITLIIVRALIIMKMYSLLNTASLNLNWNDKVGFHLSRVQCQDVETFRALVLTPDCTLESP